VPRNRRSIRGQPAKAPWLRCDSLGKPLDIGSSGCSQSPALGKFEDAKYVQALIVFLDRLTRVEAVMLSHDRYKNMADTLRRRLYVEPLSEGIFAYPDRSGRTFGFWRLVRYLLFRFMSHHLLRMTSQSGTQPE
jgi:hypothetical protein